MKKTPPGWPRLSVSAFYEDPAKAIDWLAEAFGFRVRMKIVGEGGRIDHSELEYGEALVMVGGLVRRPGMPDSGWRASPRGLRGKNTRALMLFVDNVDLHYKKAVAAGAMIASKPETVDYGPEYWSDRGYEAEDLEGHRWYFVQRVRTSPAEKKKRTPKKKVAKKAKTAKTAKKKR